MPACGKALQLRGEKILSVLYNLSVKMIQRTLEIPSRGLPKPQINREPFDEALSVHTSGVVWLTNLRSKNFIHGVRYEPCSPVKCKWAIDNSGIDPKEFSFIDIGSGKGRPLIIASQHDFAELIGVEYSPKLCKVARINLQRLRIPARIVCQDAVDFQFPDRDVFAFFYCPFGPVVLRKVLGNLRCAKRVVVAYEGSGRGAVEEHAWLKPFASLGDTAVFRNF
jgi:SAM-dependent methyltransferase